MIDPEIQKILTEIGGLRQEIKTLTKEIENLTKCKNDHEERIREQEINAINKADHKDVLDQIKDLRTEINGISKIVAKYMGIGIGIMAILTLIAPWIYQH